MLRQAALAATLLVSALAGCISPEALEAAAEDAPLPLAAAAGAAWYVVEARAGPEAPLTAFWWTVPEGAVVADPRWDKRETVALEVAFVAGDGREPDLAEWALFSFEKDDGALETRGGRVAIPVTYEHEDLGGRHRDESEVAAAPFFATVGRDNVAEGDRVGFVLAARAEAAQAFRLAFRVLPEAPDWREDEPSEDAASFLAAVAPAPPALLDVAGTGEGFGHALYWEHQGPLMPVRFVAQDGHVTVEGDVGVDARPAASARDQTLRAADGREEGWSVVSGYHHVGTGSAAWSVQGQVRREALEGSGEGASALGLYLPHFGVPVFAAVSDGEGPRDVSFRVRTDAASGESLGLFAVDLGTPLGALLGEKGRSDAFVAGGSLPSLPGLSVAGRDLVLAMPGGATLTLQDAAPRLE